MILSIDYGEKRIGLAISDETETIAFKFAILENTGIENVLERLREIILEKSITLLVIGLPLLREGKFSKSAQKVKDFSEKCNKKLSIPIKLWNEALTTEEAKKNLARNTKLDSESARILLQDYLDHQKLI